MNKPIEHDRVPAMAIEVRGLRVDLPNGGDIVDDVSFSIRKGQVLGLVGESGSGKTTVGMALLGFARGGARIVGGSVVIGGETGLNIFANTAEEWRRLRGKVVAYVPQDPASALNPALTIARQLSEVVEAHEPHAAREDVRQRMRNILGAVGLACDDAFLNRYIHQLSGGQQQRVGIAMAAILTPKVMILDEPTTGLDVTTQNRVLDLVRKLCRDFGIAALHVAHDLSVIAHIADQVMVMYGGRVVELGPVGQVFSRPEHPYTRALLGAVPELRHRSVLSVIPGGAAGPKRRPIGCFFGPRCSLVSDLCRAGPIPFIATDVGSQVRCLKAGALISDHRTVLPDLSAKNSETILEVVDVRVSYGEAKVLDGVSFSLRRGECLALVGESGSGKSTLSRCLIGLVPRQQSQIILKNQQIDPRVRARTDQQRRAMQYIFQSPHNALNPRQTVGSTIGLVHDTLIRGKQQQRATAIATVLRQVGLAPDAAGMYPDQLSGGERQRVAIARALIADPEVLICDEITSALDVSVQAAIVNLLMEIQARHGMSLLFVTHNLALVRNIADRVMVLNKGKVVEIGRTADVVARPQHDYTRALLANTLKNDLEERTSAKSIDARMSANQCFATFPVAS